MSTPLTLTEEMKNELLGAFQKALKDWNLAKDGDRFAFSLRDAYQKTDKKTKLTFTAKAYVQMYMLVNMFDSEVAWHGVVDRTDDGFLVSDILVYPQIVTGANVTTDQEEYEKWLYSEENDAVFNRIRLQGHSHVNFSTTPSSVDTTHQEGILEQLGTDDYYIFMIVNKKHAAYFRIVDRTNNIQYETSDVIFCVQGGGVTEEFFKAAQANVRERTKYTYQTAIEGRAGQGAQPLGSTYPSVATLSSGKDSGKGKRGKKEKRQKHDDETSEYYRRLYGYDPYEEYD